MALTVGTDTYATLAEAEAYASGRGNAAWTAATDTQKEFALKEAAVYLDTSYVWKGSITSDSQVMSWPRKEVKDKEGRSIANDAIPARLKDAQTEMAFLRLSAPLVDEVESGTVTEVKADTVTLKFKDGQAVTESDKFKGIDRLLTGLYVTRAGMAYISAPLTKA